MRKTDGKPAVRSGGTYALVLGGARNLTVPPRRRAHIGALDVSGSWDLAP
ncbi:hypothetical protein ABZ626_21570 [Streptomyces longispororuber]